MSNTLVFMGRLVAGLAWMALIAGYTAPFWGVALLIVWLAS